MSPFTRRALLVLTLAFTVGISWSGAFDRRALDDTRAAFKHALVAFGTARALNAAISVVQGTELALQPAGLGLTLSAGQVLDPLNDLVERFSWVMLVCAVSLGAQIAVQEIAMSGWSNWALSAAALLAVAACMVAQRWRSPTTRAAETLLLGAVVMFIFLRFIVGGAAWVSQTIGEQFLSERRDVAVAYLADTQQQIEALDTDVRTPDDSQSWLDSITNYAESQLRWFDVEKRLKDLGDVIERAVEQIVNLMVVFILQALLLPLTVLLIGALLLRRLRFGVSERVDAP